MIIDRSRTEEDLAASGLLPKDIQARELDNAVRAAANIGYSIQGYVIPYFSIRGTPVPFYRVKLFDNAELKYKQAKDTANHVYFPKGFLDVAKDSNYVIITEGEKKAACAVKKGIACCALGGVESWRNRVFTIPADSALNAKDKSIKAKIPAGTEVEENYLSPLAIGLQDLIDYLLQTGKHLIICFDTDIKEVASQNVQKAAASLGYELRFRGIPYNRIRQLRLPLLNTLDKTSLDDYLMNASTTAFKDLVQSVMAKSSAFPRHPNVRDYINKRLQKPKLSRKEMQQVSMAILTELDSGGLRLRSSQEVQTYYFDRATHRLIKATFADRPGEITDSQFGQYLYRQFGLGGADNRVYQWLGTQFTGEEPIQEVTPYRIFARPQGIKERDSIFYQISDGSYVEITGEPSTLEDPTPGFHIHDNGENNLLFESGQVHALDPEKLRAEYAKQHKIYTEGSLVPWWNEVLSDVRLKDRTSKTRMVAALLFYISPWLYRWRGTQLPIEMTLGEAGSGKSTLQELRLEIINGRPKLRNAPQDMRDWTASIAGTGGLHVTDNLQLMDKNLRNKLSDEICRIITEPDPTVEQRKLYTNADIMSVPVRCVFGITAIRQPFLNSDVLARGIVIELDKSQDLINGSLSYDSSWKSNQLHRFGGREAWVAHHLYVLHQFLLEVKRKWNLKYAAKHRLINFEQSLRTMARVFKIGDDWIPDYLAGSTAHAVEDADWAFQGIIEWANMQRTHGAADGKKTFTAAEISEWAMSTEEYEGCEEITNTRRCGRYLQTHKTMIAEQTGLIEYGKENNRVRYILVTKHK